MSLHPKDSILHRYQGVRQYSLHRNDSELPLTQFKDPVALFFLSSAHHDENFSSSRYYFSHFFRKISSLYLAKPRKYSLLQLLRFHLGCSFIIFFFIIRLKFTKHISETVRHRKLEHASKCLIRWFPVHCHYDKRSKSITSAIGSLEKQLILPNFAKVCTFNFCDYSMFRHTSWYHCFRLIISHLTVTLA